MFVIVAISVILALSYFYLTWTHSYWRKRGLTTAEPLTIFGSYPGMFVPGRSFLDKMLDIYNKYKEEHRAVGAFIGRRPHILILDPALANELLSKQFSSFRDSIVSVFIRDTKAFRYVRRNPFWAAGDYWKTQRATAKGGISQRRLTEAFPIWINSVEKFLKYIDTQLGDGTGIIGSKELCHRFTLHVMADFVWGVDAHTLDPQCNENHKFQIVAKNFGKQTFDRIYTHYVTFIAPILSRILSLRFYPAMADEFIADLTRQSIKLRQTKPIFNERVDYMQYLLNLGLDQDDIVGHSMVVLLEGYETTGVAIMQTLFYLAGHPDKQEKLRAEILENCPDVKQLNYKQLNSLKYLNQCCFESVRISSLAPQFSRTCTKEIDIELSPGKMLTIEPNTMITVPSVLYHRDPKYFPDPEEFNPERLDGDALENLQKMGVLTPFGIGPRICMGRRVGLLSMKISLVALLSKFKIERIPNLKIDRKRNDGLDISLEGPVPLRFTRLC